MNDNKTLFADIESEAFRQEAQIMNNLAILANSIRTNKNVNDFYERYFSYPAEGAVLIADRIKKLLSQPTNNKYLNKYDAAIATYLFLLNKLSREKSSELMSEIKLPQNTWWSAQMLMVLKKKEDSKKTIFKHSHVHMQRNNTQTEVSMGSQNSATANMKGVFA